MQPQLQYRQQLLHLKVAPTSLNNLLRRCNIHTEDLSTRQAAVLKHAASAVVTSLKQTLSRTHTHTHSNKQTHTHAVISAVELKMSSKKTKTWSHLCWLQFAESTTRCRNSHRRWWHNKTTTSKPLRLITRTGKNQEHRRILKSNAPASCCTFFGHEIHKVAAAQSHLLPRATSWAKNCWSYLT